MDRRGKRLSFTLFVVMSYAAFFALFVRINSSGQVIVTCSDCKPPVRRALNGLAAASFRDAYSGLGWIDVGPYSKVIPLAVFEVDGIALWWTGAELERRDYPMAGFCGRWAFLEGRAVIAADISGDSGAQLLALIDLLGKEK